MHRFFEFHLFALQHNCQGRQDGLRRTLRDTVKQCFINPHHIYIYIRWGRKGSRGPQGQGNTKCPHTLRSLTPHRLSLAHKTLCLRRDHDNNTTKLKKYVVKHFFEFYSQLTQLVLFQIYTDWKCNPRWIFKKCDPILANETAQ